MDYRGLTVVMVPSDEQQTSVGSGKEFAESMMAGLRDGVENIKRRNQPVEPQKLAENISEDEVIELYKQAAQLLVSSMKGTNDAIERAKLANALSGLSSFLGSCCGFL